MTVQEQTEDGARSTRAGDGGRPTSRRCPSPPTAASTSPSTTSSTSMTATGCSTSPAAPGWPSSSPRCGGRPARASTPPPGSSRSPGTATPTPTCGWGTCTRCRGSRIVRRRHELPRGLGHHAGRAHRDPPRARARRSPRPHRLGPHQGLARRVGPVPVPAGRPARVANQAAMVALGRPGAGEELLSAAGFVDVRRLDVPFAWEFADPEIYARALARPAPPTRPSGPSVKRPSTTRPSLAPSRSATACRCAPRSPSPATSRAKAEADIADRVETASTTRASSAAADVRIDRYGLRGRARLRQGTGWSRRPEPVPPARRRRPVGFQKSARASDRR